MLGKQLRQACCIINGNLPWTKEKPAYKSNQDIRKAAMKGDEDMAKGELSVQSHGLFLHF
jgi:hypothetical protein